MSIKVKITECYGDYNETVLNSRSSDLDIAITSAIRKAYGSGVFIRDNGISLGPNALAGSQYGQIGKSTGNGYSMKTGRVCIRAEEN